MSKINKTMSPFEWLLLIALSILWGGAYFFGGVAVRELPTFVIVVSRVGLAALILLAVMRMLGQRMPTDRRIWAAFLAMGLLNNAIPFSLIVWGQSHVASGVASILNGTAPLFTVLVAHGLTRDEKMTGGRIFGVLAGLIGVAVMIGGQAVDSLGVDVLAQLAFLGAASSYAFAGVFGRRFQALGVTPMATATGQVTASSLILLPVMLFVDQPWTLPLPSAATVSALFGLAALSTALAYILYFRLLATAGATNLLLVTLLIPVSAILLGVMVLGESMAAKHFLGMALIALGLAAIDGRLWKLAVNRR
ncbi:MAG: DMT family transporter [Rhodospirillaceae bacterium]|jgi:drug/metabolite transporter (DMT)-like permease|nr:DMT family transporter [Rhodospirillaceae bacterium]MBT4489528.1 DMT family transporter [Rhodospirillaceae bacterium]MBT5190738.1 DMT family transporter [Rhodospirillaceae bacterium]MBT5897541.1 DMT family transporter [Rhodospirillaceae bacterium]MBT6428533.1 DMT family transporter [Rhodospirillaceae bacterium]